MFRGCTSKVVVQKLHFRNWTTVID